MIDRRIADSQYASHLVFWNGSNIQAQCGSRCRRWAWAGEKSVLNKLRVHPDFVAPFSPPCEGGVRGGGVATARFSRLKNSFMASHLSPSASLSRGGKSRFRFPRLPPPPPPPPPFSPFFAPLFPSHPPGPPLCNSVRHSFCLLPLPAHPKTSCKSDMFNIYLTCALLAPRAF